MTQILFRENKFWIDGIEVINPGLLPETYSEHFSKTVYKKNVHENAIFPLPENLSQTIETIREGKHSEDGILLMGENKKLIRLKLKDETQGKIMLGIPEYGDNAVNSEHEIAIDPQGYAIAAAKILDALKLVIGVDVNEFAMPTIVQLMKNNIRDPLQKENEKLKNGLYKIVSEYENYLNGFELLSNALTFKEWYLTK